MLARLMSTFSDTKSSQKKPATTKYFCPIEYKKKGDRSQVGIFVRARETFDFPGRFPRTMRAHRAWECASLIREWENHYSTICRCALSLLPPLLSCVRKKKPGSSSFFRVTRLCFVSRQGKSSQSRFFSFRKCLRREGREKARCEKYAINTRHGDMIYERAVALYGSAFSRRTRKSWGTRD